MRRIMHFIFGVAIPFIVTTLMYAAAVFAASATAVWLVCLLLGFKFCLKYVGVLVVVWFYYRLMYGQGLATNAFGDDK